MKPVAFDYVRPTSISEACALLAGDDGARIIAGGQTLIPMLAMRLARPTRLVDIARIVALAFIRDEAEGVASALLEPHEGLRLEAAPFDAPLAAALGAGEAPQLRLLPQIHGTDGYFVASFVAHRQ